MELIWVLVILFIVIGTATSSKKNTKKVNRPQQMHTGQNVRRMMTETVTYERTIPKNDIITKANENIKKMEQMKKTVKSSGIPNEKRTVPPAEEKRAEVSEIRNRDPEIVDTSVPNGDLLMQEVNDLMIKGYTETLTFERDFVAEGIEMLNRI